MSALRSLSGQVCHECLRVAVRYHALGVPQLRVLRLGTLLLPLNHANGMSGGNYQSGRPGKRGHHMDCLIHQVVMHLIHLSACVGRCEQRALLAVIWWQVLWKPTCCCSGPRLYLSQ